VFTLDAWRKRVAQSQKQEKLVAIEIVEGRDAGLGSTGTGTVAASGQFRIVLADGLRIEIEPGFDVDELRRLLAALAPAPFRAGLSHGV
jgi:hypothetical protein